MNNKRVNMSMIMIALLVVPASTYAKTHAKTQVMSNNNVEFTLTDYTARDTVKYPDLVIPYARSLFKRKIIPLRVTIKNMTEQDIIFSPSQVLQADVQDLYDACKYSEAGEPLAILVMGSWGAALLFIAEHTAYLRGQRSTRGALALGCAALTCALGTLQERHAKEKNKRLKNAFESRVQKQEITIPVGGTHDTVLFIDEIDLWQPLALKVQDVRGQVIASCPLDLRLSFNFSADINAYEYQGGLK
jgi:hypothetical protein